MAFGITYFMQYLYQKKYLKNATIAGSLISLVTVSMNVGLAYIFTMLSRLNLDLLF